MKVEILRRERTGGGWVRYWGAVNNEKIGVRLALVSLEGLSDRQAEKEVRDALHCEYLRLRKGDGGAAEDVTP